MAVHRISSRRLAVVWLTAVMSIVSACADAPYERVNAYDPGLKVPGRIVGLPDTFFAFGDSAQPRLEVDERYRGIPVEWSVRIVRETWCIIANCGQMSINATTGTVVASPSPLSSRWEIRAKVAEQWFYDTIATRQIPVSFQSFCRWPGNCDANAFDSPFHHALTDVTPLDANGSPLLIQTDSIKLAGASWAVRDTTIANLVNGELRSRYANGTTWVIRRQYGKEDSVQLRVSQRLSRAEVTCQQTADISDTVRIATTVRDVNGSLLQMPVTYSWSLRLRREDNLLVSRPIASDGTFVPMEPGEWNVFLTVAQREPGTYTIEAVASCKVLVS
jgi:hypothetical protein